MTHEEAVKLIDQQKQIPHPINTVWVHLIHDIIYYDDGKARWPTRKRKPISFT